MTSSPGADVLRHQARQQRVAARGDADGVRAARIAAMAFSHCVNLRAEDEVLRLDHFRDRRVDLGLDGRVLRFKIEQAARS